VFTLFVYFIWACYSIISYECLLYSFYLFDRLFVSFLVTIILLVYYICLFYCIISCVLFFYKLIVLID